jgi:hypothetical protein
MAPLSYRIEYTPEALEHLADLSARDGAIVLDSVPVQLKHQPIVATRNRKLLRANDIAPWELRLLHLRVYYDMVEVPEPVVTIRAIGIKDRNRVFVGGQEVKL